MYHRQEPRPRGSNTYAFAGDSHDIKPLRWLASKSSAPHAMDDFAERLFCESNRSTASQRRGPASRVLVDRCSAVWASRPDPFDAVCHDLALDRRHTEWCEGVARDIWQHPLHLSDLDVAHAELPLPLDDSTLDDARHHCGLPDIPWDQLSSMSRRARNAIEDALLCERSASSPLPGGAGVAVRRHCASIKHDLHASVSIFVTEAGGNIHTMHCVVDRLRGLDSD
nr:hypothetical protein [Pandoravirus massiliensis]